MLCYRLSFQAFLSGSVVFVLKGTGVYCWSVCKALAITGN